MPFKDSGLDREYDKFVEDSNSETAIRVRQSADTLDPSTYALNSIMTEHHEIHEGDHYFVSDYESGMGNSDTVEFVLTTSDTTKWIHLVLNFTFIAGGILDVYEGTSGVSGGTLVTPLNNNRNSSNTSNVTIIMNPSGITDDGTRIEGFLAGANRKGGTNAREREIILKQNTSYLFRFTATANSNALDYNSEWYEHTNKN